MVNDRGGATEAPVAAAAAHGMGEQPSSSVVSDSSVSTINSQCLYDLPSRRRLNSSQQVQDLLQDLSDMSDSLTSDEAALFATQIHRHASQLQASIQACRDLRRIDGNPASSHGSFGGGGGGTSSIYKVPPSSPFVETSIVHQVPTSSSSVQASQACAIIWSLLQVIGFIRSIGAQLVTHVHPLWFGASAIFSIVFSVITRIRVGSLMTDAGVFCIIASLSSLLGLITLLEFIFGQQYLLQVMLYHSFIILNDPLQSLCSPLGLLVLFGISSFIVVSPLSVGGNWTSTNLTTFLSSPHRILFGVHQRKKPIYQLFAVDSFLQFCNMHYHRYALQFASLVSHLPIASAVPCDSVQYFNFNGVSSTSTCYASAKSRQCTSRRVLRKHSFRRSSSSSSSSYYLYHLPGFRPRRKPPHVCNARRSTLGSVLPSLSSRVLDSIDWNTSSEGASCLVLEGESPACCDDHSLQSVVNLNWTRNIRARDKSRFEEKENFNEEHLPALDVPSSVVEYESAVAVDVSDDPTSSTMDSTDGASDAERVSTSEPEGDGVESSCNEFSKWSLKLCSSASDIYVRNQRLKLSATLENASHYSARNMTHPRSAQHSQSSSSKSNLIFNNSNPIPICPFPFVENRYISPRDKALLSGDYSLASSLINSAQSSCWSRLHSRSCNYVSGPVMSEYVAKTVGSRLKKEHFFVAMNHGCPFDCNLVKSLYDRGIYQSKCDPCVFHSEKVVVILFDGGSLFFGEMSDDIQDILLHLQEEGLIFAQDIYPSSISYMTQSQDSGVSSLEGAFRLVGSCIMSVLRSRSDFKAIANGFLWLLLSFASGFFDISVFLLMKSTFHILDLTAEKECCCWLHQAKTGLAEAQVTLVGCLSQIGNLSHMTLSVIRSRIVTPLFLVSKVSKSIISIRVSLACTQ